MVPFDDRDGWIWLDGHYVPWREAQIHVLTHGLHYGGCVFEGERAYGGRIFKSREHSERLHASASYLGYRIPYSVNELEALKTEVLQRNGFDHCYIRTFAWRGSEKMGLSARKMRTRTAIAAWEWGDFFDDKEKGITITMARWRRPSPLTIPCHAKASGLYMICTQSKDEAQAQGYADALLLDHRGLVAETTGANIFFVRDGCLHTPTPDCFLDGITRQTVIALAEKRAITVMQRHIRPEELADFSECFITGTAAEITPVRTIAAHRYKPGALTFSLMEDFATLTTAHLIGA